MAGFDVAQDYLQGVHTGAAIAQESKRIAAENVRTQMEATARAETNQREYLQEQARAQTEAAYKTAVLGLQKQKLDQAAQINQQRTQFAATKMAHQHGFDSAIAAGVPVMDALSKFPLASAGPAIAQEKETREAAGAKTREERLQGHEKAMEGFEQSRLDLEQGRLNKPVVTGRTETQVTDAGDPNKKTTTFQNVYGQPGATPIPPAAAKPVSQPLPLPTKKSDLQKGAQYQTHKGVRTWDGEKFVLQ